jgi:hypothetical protein
LNPYATLPAVKRCTVDGLRIHPNVLGLSRGERCALGECRAACCANGVWVDAAHVERVRAHAADVARHLPPDRRDPAVWFEDEVMDCEDFPSGHGHPTATVIDPDDPDRDVCVFLRPDRLCALQVASGALGLPHPGLKPFDCATYPVLRSEGELLLDLWSPDELDGADCQRATAEPRPVLEVFREELELVLGEDGYRRLCAKVARRR